MGNNPSNPDSEEDERLSIGSSVDPLPLNREARKERKQLKKSDKEGERSIRILNENNSSESNQSSVCQNVIGNIENETAEHTQMMEVNVQSNEEKTSTDFTDGPVIEACDDFPKSAQNKLLVNKESHELQRENNVDYIPPPVRQKVQNRLCVDEKLTLIKRGEEKDTMMLEHTHNDNDKIDQPNTDQKTTKDAYRPIIEPCEDRSDGLQDEKSPVLRDTGLSKKVEGYELTDYVEIRGGMSSEASKALQKLVQSCSESVDNLEQNNRYIMELVNKSCSSQSSLNKEGLKIITELESIVEKFTERRSEKENAIRELKCILSKLTDNVKILEQEIQNLQSKSNGNKTDNQLQCEQVPSSENQLDCSFSKSQGLALPNATSYRDMKQTEKIKHEDTIPNTKDPVPTIPNIDERKGMPLDGQDSDNRGETKLHLLHVNPRRDEKDSGEGVEEVNTLEVNDTLESGSQHKDSAIHNEEDEEDTVSTNVQENSHDIQTDSGSSDVPSDFPGVHFRTLTDSDSNTQTNNTDSQSEDDFQNIKWKSPNPLREQHNSSRIQDQPNIVLTQNPSPKQVSRKYLPDNHWQQKAAELKNMLMREEPPDNECGWNTVLCLDISDSMWGDAIRTMIHLAQRFISGVAESPYTEKVGVVCFGGDTRVISRCCLNFYMLRQEISKLMPGGPSPLTAGLLLSNVLIDSGVTLPHANGVGFFPRIIIFSDGMATPECVGGSEDFTSDDFELSTITKEMTKLAHHYRSNCNRVYYVPLGQAKEDIIGPMVSMTHGKIVRPSDFDTLIHQFRDELLAIQIRPHLRNHRQADASTVRTVAQLASISLKGINMDRIAEYVRNPSPQRGRQMDDDDDDDDDDNEHNEVSSNMPPIGTRVRRGPDWEPSFGQQDSNGPGTVVSQDRDGFLSIMWDNGHRNIYPYGLSGRYAVMVVDEPRVLQLDQFIEVGCLVRRGTDWRDNNNDGGSGSIGVVFRVHSDATVGVRWPTGQLRRYKYGKQGYFEVELCDPFDGDVRLRMLSMNLHASSDISTRLQDKEQIRIEDVINSDDRRPSILDERNRKNAAQSNQSHNQVTTNSGHTLHDENVGQERTNNRDKTDDNLDDTEIRQPVCASDDPVTCFVNNKEVEANPDNNIHMKNSADTYVDESLNQVPNRAEEAMSSVENANDSFVASDIIQKVVGEGGINFEKSMDCRSSSPEGSIDSDLSCVYEVNNIDVTTRQTASSTYCAREREAKETQNSHDTVDEEQDNHVQDVVWQINDRYEGWKDFPNDISNRLERVFLRNPRGMFSYTKNKKRFQVQLSKMIQVHPITKEICSVRRKNILEH